MNEQNHHPHISTEYGDVTFDREVTTDDPEAPDHREQHRQQMVGLVVHSLLNHFGEELTRQIVAENNSYSQLRTLQSDLLSLLKDIQAQEGHANVKVAAASRSPEELWKLLQAYRAQ